MPVASVPPMNHWRRSSASVRYRHTVSTGASRMRSRRIALGAIFSTGSRIVAASFICVLLLLVAFDQRLEAVEAAGPVFLPLTEPAFGFGERLGNEADEMRTADLAARQKAGILQHLHVLGCTRERHVE